MLYSQSYLLSEQIVQGADNSENITNNHLPWRDNHLLLETFWILKRAKIQIFMYTIILASKKFYGVKKISSRLYFPPLGYIKLFSEETSP